MRASELLASVVVDGAGRRVGAVRDVRLAWETRAGGGSAFRVVELVAGDGPLAGIAHAWGFAEGRARGPWLLRLLTASATRRAVVVPADRVADWGPGEVRITGDTTDLAALGAAPAR